MKRIVLTVILALCIALSVGMLCASAVEVASGTYGDNITWTLDDAGTLTISGEGEMESYYEDNYWYDYYNSIKTLVIEHGVLNIPDFAFFGYVNLENVIMSNSVSSIGYSAFEECCNLLKVEISSNVTSIGYCAFSGCIRLMEIELPDGITDLDQKAFYGCTSLSKVKFSNSLEYIGGAAFKNCTSLLNINIPNTVTSVGSEAFNNTAFYNDESNWYNNELYLDDILIAIKGTIEGEYKIREGTRIIADKIFKDQSELTRVKFPEGIAIISNSAFSKCKSLESVTIPNSVIQIHPHAFQDCEKLKTVHLGDNVERIGGYSFSGCTALESINIPNSLTYIGDYAFSSTNLKKLYIPQGVASFNYTNVISGPKFMGYTVDPQNTVYCSDENGVLYSKNMTSLMQYPRNNTAHSFTIPDSVTNIGSYAFSSCKYLTDLIIPKSVTTFYNGAIYNCENLTVYGSIGSHAETYAKENDIPFVPVIIIPGNIDDSMSTDYEDVKYLAALLATGNITSLSEKQVSAANLYTQDDGENGKAVINIKDMIALAQLVSTQNL